MSRHSARSHAYRRAAAALRSRRLPCWLCGQPIDYDLVWPDPGSYSTDHAVPMAQGGYETEGLQPAHLRCNQSRGASKPRPSIGRTSEEW